MNKSIRSIFLFSGILLLFLTGCKRELVNKSKIALPSDGLDFLAIDLQQGSDGHFYCIGQDFNNSTLFYNHVVIKEFDKDLKLIKEIHLPDHIKTTGTSTLSYLGDGGWIMMEEYHLGFDASYLKAFHLSNNFEVITQIKIDIDELLEPGVFDIIPTTNGDFYLSWEQVYLRDIESYPFVSKFNSSLEEVYRFQSDSLIKSLPGYEWGDHPRITLNEDGSVFYAFRAWVADKPIIVYGVVGSDGKRLFEKNVDLEKDITPISARQVGDIFVLSAIHGIDKEAIFIKVERTSGAILSAESADNVLVNNSYKQPSRMSLLDAYTSIQMLYNPYTKQLQAVKTSMGSTPFIAFDVPHPNAQEIYTFHHLVTNKGSLISAGNYFYNDEVYFQLIELTKEGDILKN